MSRKIFLNTQFYHFFNTKFAFRVFLINLLSDTIEYSFEVENDYMDWEMAIDGLKTVNVKLKELQGNKSFSTRS